MKTEKCKIKNFNKNINPSENKNKITKICDLKFLRKSRDKRINYK